MPHRRRLLSLFAAAPLAAAPAMTGCETNPATGRSQFIALSREQEVAIGAESAPQMLQEYGGEVRSTTVQAYVRQVGQSLAAETEADYPSLPWEFFMLDSQVINAFALPGGKVFISRGLAEKMTNEAQMAFVLGHEVGHVTARHINDRMVEQMKVQIGAGVLAALLGQGEAGLVQQAGLALVDLGGQGYLLRFNREQELQADALGMRYMVESGYDPVGALQAMQILDREGGARGGPEFLQTHPYPDTRIARIQERLDGEYAQAAGSPRLELHAERFQQQALRPLSQLPPSSARAPGEPERIALADPATWCAVCRSEEHAHSN